MNKTIILIAAATIYAISVAAIHRLVEGRRRGKDGHIVYGRFSSRYLQKMFQHSLSQLGKTGFDGYHQNVMREITGELRCRASRKNLLFAGHHSRRYRACLQDSQL